MEEEKKICPLLMIFKKDGAVCLGEACAWYFRPKPPEYFYVDEKGEQQPVSLNPETQECALLKLAKKK